MELHSEVGYGWTPLSRYSSEEHNYNMNGDPAMAGMIAPPPLHPSVEHMYSEINPVASAMQLPHSMAQDMMVGCGLTQSPAALPPYSMSGPQYGIGIPMMPPIGIGINDLPPYSH